MVYAGTVEWHAIIPTLKSKLADKSVPRSRDLIRRLYNRTNISKSIVVTINLYLAWIFFTLRCSLSNTNLYLFMQFHQRNMFMETQ